MELVNRVILRYSCSFYKQRGLKIIIYVDFGKHSYANLVIIILLIAFQKMRNNLVPMTKIITHHTRYRNA